MMAFIKADESIPSFGISVEIPEEMLVETPVAPPEGVEADRLE